MKYLEKIAEKEDLKLYITKQDKQYCIEFEFWSNLDEDYIITLLVGELTKKEIQEAMYEYINCFDAEEHAVELYNLHGRGGTPTIIRELLQDADEIEEKLNKIYKTMGEI